MGRWRKSLTKAILGVTGLIYLFSVLLMNNLPMTDLHVFSNACCSNLSLNMTATALNASLEGAWAQLVPLATNVPSQAAVTTLAGAEELSITSVTTTMNRDKVTNKIALTNRPMPASSSKHTGQYSGMTQSGKVGQEMTSQQAKQDLHKANKQVGPRLPATQSESKLLLDTDNANSVLQKSVGGHPGGPKKHEWSSEVDREGGWARQLINQEGLCDASEDMPTGPYLLILVQSNFAQSAQRNAIRDTWGRVRNDFTSPRHVIVVFLLGAPNDTDIKSWDNIHKESAMYRDVLLWNIGDGQHNHTAKSILGLLWSFEYCPQAKYVLKTVDDIYLNVSGIVEYLSELWASKYTVTGHVELSGRTPHCSGAAYAVGMDFVRGINRFLYSWLSTFANSSLPEEDVYITATLAATLGRQCRHEQRFPTHETTMNPGELCKALGGDSFGVHGVSFQMMYLIWKASQEPWDCGQRPEGLHDWLSQQYQYLNLYEEVEDGFTGG